MTLVRITFECTDPECGAEVEFVISLAEPNYSAERMTDGDSFEEHDVACPECGKDYEVETVNGMGGMYATMDGGDVGIEQIHEPDYDDYDDFLNRYEPANDTVGAFEEARRQLLALIAVHGADPTSILNRMVFSQLIAALEAYLSDKVLRLATDHPQIKRRIASGAGFVKEQTLKLSEVLLDPGKAETAFKVGLQRILYHDLERVEKLYRIALAGEFYPPDGSVKTELERAILMRHDCVHRNGVDLGGTRHAFDDATIRNLSDRVTALVDHVEEQANKAIASLVPPP